MSNINKAAFYEGKIAPELRRLRDMCEAEGIALVAQVGISADKTTSIATMAGGHGAALWLTVAAAHAKGDVDQLFSAIMGRLGQDGLFESVEPQGADRHEPDTLEQAAQRARLAADVLCYSLRDGRVTGYPARQAIAQNIGRVAQILNAVAPRAPIVRDRVRELVG